MTYLLHFSLLAAMLLVMLFGQTWSLTLGGRVGLSCAVAVLLSVSLLAGIRDAGRSKSAGLRSAQLGFYLYLLLGFLVIIHEFFAKGQEPPQYLYALVYVPLAATGYMSLVRRLGLKGATRWISILVAVMWLGFALLSEGFTIGGAIEAAPFILIILPAVLVSRKPRVAGSILLLLGAAAFWFFGAGWLRTGPWQLLLMAALMPLPLLLLGLALLMSRRP